MGLFSKKKPKTLKDKHLSQAPQSLGGTTANEVYKTSYKKGKSFAGKGAQDGYFKEDTRDTTAKYAVGASSLAKGMGLGSLIPETKFATHDLTDRKGNLRQGVTGAVSKGATGEALMDNVYDTDKTDEFLAGTAGKDDDERAQMANFAGLKNVGGRWMGHSGDEINDMDLSDPAIQKGLNDLQWFDALIGNADRHGGNILIDQQSGQVTGIDNDLSFGMGELAKMGNKTSEDFEKGASAKYLGLPQMLDTSMAKKLMDLDAKKLTKLLNPKGGPKDQKFSDKELQQAVDRLDVIQVKVQEMMDNDQLTDQWDDNTYQQQINEDVSGRVTGWNADPYGSYVQRQHRMLQEATDTDNDVMWRKGHRQADTTPAQLPTPPLPAPPQRQAPAPPPQSAKPTSTSANPSTQPVARTLSSRVANTPWADQLKKPKQRA